MSNNYNTSCVLKLNLEQVIYRQPLEIYENIELFPVSNIIYKSNETHSNYPCQSSYTLDNAFNHYGCVVTHCGI